MLYKYNFIKKHKVEELNKQLNYFFYKIRSLDPSSSFQLEKYFHSSFITILNDSNELTKKFETFFETFKKLSNENKNEFYKLIINNSHIEDSFENINVCCLNMQTDNIKSLLGNNSLNILMNHLFEVTLKSKRYKIKEHYEFIYNSMPKKVCPFCGLTKMHKTFQEDYDHLAPKSKYPLLAINIKNLAPMCHVCNTKFKKEIDIYYSNKIRRPFAYPYKTVLNIDIDFSGSIIDQSSISDISGSWKIKIVPNSPINETWVDIFQIEKRYKEDYLDVDFNDWIDEFIDSLIKDNVILKNSKDVINQLSLMADSLYTNRLTNCNIIKAPLFRFLSKSNFQVFYDSILFKYNKNLVA